MKLNFTSDYKNSDGDIPSPNRLGKTVDVGGFFRLTNTAGNMLCDSAITLPNLRSERQDMIDDIINNYHSILANGYVDRNGKIFRLPESMITNFPNSTELTFYGLLTSCDLSN